MISNTPEDVIAEVNEKLERLEELEQVNTKLMSLVHFFDSILSDSSFDAREKWEGIYLRAESCQDVFNLIP